MLKSQYPFIDENGQQRENLICHYSDANKYILQNETGSKYDKAIDVYPCKYTYTETDEDITTPEDETIDVEH